MNLVWNRSESRLRAGWRIVLQILIMGALGVLPILLVAEPLTALHRRGLFLAGYNHAAYDRVINIMVGPLFAAAVLGSVVIARRYVDRRLLEGLGVKLDRAWWHFLWVGFALGATLMTSVFALEYFAGWIELTGFGTVNVAGVSIWLALSYSVVKVLCVGVYEEFVSRGYLLRNLADGTSLRWAVALSSLVFALLHMGNENASLMSTLGLIVNGCLFAAAVIVTGRLSAAIGLHISWNLFEGAIFGFPVSGDKEGASLIGTDQRGPDLITGGAFGPEAGLVGIAVSFAGILMLLLLRRSEKDTHGVTERQAV